MRFIYLLFILLFTNCGVGFQYTTLNHTGHIDGIYSSNNYTIDTLNEFQFRNKLKTDFNFRYDFAQYALNQPRSFDWNNRVLGNRYNVYSPYYNFSYSNYWSRDMMWNDWVWSYPYSNRIGWSYSWNNNRWSLNSWNSPYGWDNYYGWNTGYRRSNVIYRTNKRGRPVNTNSRRIIGQSVITTTTPRKVVTPKPRRVIRNTKTSVIRTKSLRRTQTVIPTVRANTPTRTIRVISNRTQPTRRVNSRKKN